MGSGGPPQQEPMRLRHLADNLHRGRAFGGSVGRLFDPVIQNRHRRHKWLDPVRKGYVIGMHKVSVARPRAGESEQESVAVSTVEALWAGVLAPFEIVDVR